MNFEEALKHCKDGTATQEEKDYVQSQMAMANSMFDDDAHRAAPPVKEATPEEVKKAKKRLKSRYIVIPVVVLVAIVLVVGAILGGVFGYAATAANKNSRIDRNRMIADAKTYAFDVLSKSPMAHPFVTSEDDLRLESVDKDFRYNPRDIGKSYYTYEITFVAFGAEVEIEVDPRFVGTAHYMYTKDVDLD